MSLILSLNYYFGGSVKTSKLTHFYLSCHPESNLSIVINIRQQLRENSQELRDLERKLKAAYVNKELAAQIAQKQAEKINEKVYVLQSFFMNNH